MNIWAKMMTALRGGVNEAGDAIIDGQALRILDREIRDAYEHLKQSKDSLAAIMAHQKVAEQTCTKLQQRISDNEGYALKALEQDNETLALEVAEKIAQLDTQLQAEQHTASHYAHSAAQLRSVIKQTERNLNRMKHQVDTVKATENVQRAQATIAQRHGGANAKLRTAMDSLDSIKDRQALQFAHSEAARDLAEEASHDSLQAKLENAGIIVNSRSADTILSALKAKQQ